MALKARNLHLTYYTIDDLTKILRHISKLVSLGSGMLSEKEKGMKEYLAMLFREELGRFHRIKPEKDLMDVINKETPLKEYERELKKILKGEKNGL